MVPGEDKLTGRSAVARRLKITRRAMGFSTDKEFYEGAGIEASQWGNSTSKKGKNRLSIENAIKLVETYQHLDFNWIYRGDKSGLPAKLQAEITQTEKDYPPGAE